MAQIAPAGEIYIRPAASTDAPRLIAIEQASFIDPWSPHSLQQALRDERTVIVVASQAKDGAGVCGYAMAWNIGDEAEVTRLAVLEAARGRGIGGHLARALLYECAQRGAEHVFLEVRDGNTTARRLYMRCGFAEVGRRRRYYHNGEDAVIMRWESSRAGSVPAQAMNISQADVNSRY